MQQSRIDLDAKHFQFQFDLFPYWGAIIDYQRSQNVTFNNGIGFFSINGRFLGFNDYFLVRVHSNYSLMITL